MTHPLRILVAALLFSLPLAAQAPCNSTITFNGTPSLGSTIQIQLDGVAGCHACAWVSKNPGPTNIGNIVIPIGLPLLGYFDFGVFPQSAQLFASLNIPNDPNIIGLQLFFTNAGFPQGSAPTLQNVVLSPAAVLTIQP